jgi:lipopolysaccharide export system permease protein
VTLLRRYVMLAVFKGVATALGVLVAVGGVVEFVGQLDDVGTGEFGLAEAVSYVVLRIPRTIFEMLPAAALIGALLGLGNLAVHRELVVMRASGISRMQLMGSVALAGFGLTILMALLGESLAPSLGAYAREMRSQAMLEDVDMADGQSVWLKDGDRILNLRRQIGEFGYGGGVLIFDLGAGQALDRVARASSAEIGASDQWRLENYAETTFSADQIGARSEPVLMQPYNLSPDLLDLAAVRHDLLDTPALQRYIRYLRSNELDADRYLTAYWGRMADIVSVTLMTTLALPFVFGGLRSAGAGARLLVGLLIGLGYYVVGQVLEQSGEVFDLDPVVVAWAPSAALLLVTVVALARAR